MITGGINNWHYLAVKSLSRLFRGITPYHNGDFYCLNCFYSYCTNNVLKKHEGLCSKNDFCHVKMPNEGKKLLEYNSREKSLTVLFIIYADLECLLKKIYTCWNNPEESYIEKKAKHKPSGYSRVTC